jgi:hypothetical protein
LVVVFLMESDKCEQMFEGEVWATEKIVVLELFSIDVVVPVFSIETTDDVVAV